MKVITRLVLACLATVVSPLANAQPSGVTVTVHAVDANGVGTVLGQVRLGDTPQGLRIEPSLAGLPPGPRGFHVHEKPSCAPALKDGRPVAALAAGPHYDPHGSGHHGGPHGSGHMGDLPELQVDAQGRASQPLLAPRLRLRDVLNRSLMIHAGGDNHSDHPAPLGGGGARIACGVIPAAQNS